jgi:flagellar assembly factor FliW
MIRIENTRFGSLTLDEEGALRFPRGVLGFPGEDRFVLVEREGHAVGFLQSLKTASLCFPVVGGELFLPDYPRPEGAVLAREAGLDCDDPTLLVIVAARSGAAHLTANLLAPLVIDPVTRTGAQVVLDSRVFSAEHALEKPASRSVPSNRQP